MLKDIVSGVKAQVSEKILNREFLTEMALASFFAGGHILLTGGVGLGKKAWTKAIAGALGLSWEQVRLDEDSSLYDAIVPHEIKTESHVSNTGTQPLLSQVFLAEGIAALQPRLQAFFADAMEETTISLYDRTYQRVEPFFLIATKGDAGNLSGCLNDRFMMQLPLTYPGVAAEKQLLQMHHNGEPMPSLYPVCNPEAIIQAKEEVQAVTVDEAIFNNIVSIAETTRRVGAVITGASPRGSIALLQASKAYAAIQGRNYVTQEDVRTVAMPVLRHRLKLKPEAVKEGLEPDYIVESILAGKGPV